MIDLQNIASHLPGPVDVAIILGSGLGPFADTISGAFSLRTSELPGYPQSTVAGHAGRIVVGKLGSKSVLAFQGRVHMYEGHSPAAVTIPVQLAQKLGARILIVTNASGSFTIRFAPGDLLLIEDHINLQFRNPLIALKRSATRQDWPQLLGQAASEAPVIEARLNETFFYDQELLTMAETTALRLKIPLKRGTLAALTGPTYESPAEARMLARLGADAGCMSTVPEVIMAKALGLRVLGISCVTNVSAILPGSVLDHEDVQAVAQTSSEKFQRLLREIITQCEF